MLIPGSRVVVAVLVVGATIACTSEPSGAQVVTTERIPTTLQENGTPVFLEMVIHKPEGPGPFPTVVFHHGSTGSGSDTTLFTQTWSFPSFSRVANARGWMVVFPQRRGRGKSDGRYDEGFESDRSRYSCNPLFSLPGLERAMEDVDAVVAHLRTRTDVIQGRMVVAGQSRGGVLAIAHAGTRPGVFLGAINFVGGWMSDGCPDAEAINTVSFRRGAGTRAPTLWLYGENDPFYSMSHSRKNFEAFRAAGGMGAFFRYALPSGVNGHLLIAHPDRWREPVEAFLDGLSATPAPGH